MTQIWRLDSLLVLPLLADNPPCLNSAYSSFTASITTSPSIGISFFSVSLEIKSFLDIASGSMLAREPIFARLWPKDNCTSLRSIPAKDLTGARGEFNKFKLNLWNLEKCPFWSPGDRKKHDLSGTFWFLRVNYECLCKSYSKYSIHFEIPCLKSSIGLIHTKHHNVERPPPGVLQVPRSQNVLLSHCI